MSKHLRGKENNASINPSRHHPLAWNLVMAQKTTNPEICASSIPWVKYFTICLLGNPRLMKTMVHCSVKKLRRSLQQWMPHRNHLFIAPRQLETLHTKFTPHHNFSQSSRKMNPICCSLHQYGYILINYFLRNFN